VLLAQYWFARTRWRRSTQHKSKLNELRSGSGYGDSIFHAPIDVTLPADSCCCQDNSGDDPHRFLPLIRACPAPRRSFDAARINGGLFRRVRTRPGAVAGFHHLQKPRPCVPFRMCPVVRSPAVIRSPPFADYRSAGSTAEPPERLRLPTPQSPTISGELGTATRPGPRPM